MIFQGKFPQNFDFFQVILLKNSIFQGKFPKNFDILGIFTKNLDFLRQFKKNRFQEFRFFRQFNK